MQRILLSRALLAAAMIDLDLGEEAKEFGRRHSGPSRRRAATSWFSAEANPTTRDALVGAVLTELGAWDLDPRTDADELEAAAALCRSAGYWALPYPVAERLARPAETTRRTDRGRRPRPARALAGSNSAGRL